MLKVIENYPLSEITTLQIGGPARYFVSATSQEELIETISFAKKNNTSFLVIGGGSNLLVADEGVNKLIIQNGVEGIKKDRNVLVVKSGTVLQNLVDYTIAHGLSGLQKMTGIPGTVGGAIYGNAGAYGQTISDCLVEVTCFDGVEIITLQKDECRFGYRYSIFKENLYTILEIKFKLEESRPGKLERDAKEVLSKRLVKYPKGIKCPGSFFKNLIASEIPPHILKNVPEEKVVYGKVPAGALLEMVGAIGDKEGDIEIASYHANLFINKGKGTAKDFYNLAKKYYQKVKEKFGISLEPEVQLVNLKPLI